MSDAEIRKSPSAAALHGLSIANEDPKRLHALRAPSSGPTEIPTLPSQAAFLNKWDTDTLNVFFINGSTKMQDRVFEQVQKWSDVCNLKFKPSTLANSHVRVTFNRGEGHFSFVGIEALQMRGQQTMNLDMTQDTMLGDYNLSVILHEFGHAMGLVHEHSSPDSNLKFAGMNQLINFFRGKFGEGTTNTAKTQELIEHNILKKYREGEVTKFSKFDPESIMIYALPAEVLAPGSGPMRANLELSATDKKYAADLYGPSSNPNGNQGGKDQNSGDTNSSKKSSDPKQFTAGGEAVGCYLSAGSTVELKLVVPNSQADKRLAIYTTGTTRVMLTLKTSSGTEISLTDKSEHGSPDFMNEVIMKNLSAGDYKVSIKHPSSSGGGSFKIQANSESFDKYLFGRNKAQ
ncbi:M12 family metallopeptidase [Anatilimnocola floriformis]|uniref:M12 family metallopeptidase n=1 Tax=Anatilimnocola floriformis TaxID=2948575 RepID=UPI0020C55B5D|nr:M12 family metallopeptidase [Anatilimnocola floriformis]